MIQIQVGRVLKLGEYQKKKSKQKMCDNSEYKKCNLELVFLLEV